MLPAGRAAWGIEVADMKAHGETNPSGRAALGRYVQEPAPGSHVSEVGLTARTATQTNK